MFWCFSRRRNCLLFWLLEVANLKAEDGIGLPEEILDRSSFESSAKFYFIFIKFDYIWSLNYFALIVLNFLEVCFCFCFCFFLLFLDSFTISSRIKPKEFIVLFCCRNLCGVQRLVLVHIHAMIESIIILDSCRTWLVGSLLYMR